jgi:pyruvate kinase
VKEINPPPHKTKIVCTIGPSSNSRAVISRLIKAGMNVARLNLSHGSIEEHIAALTLLRAEAARQNKTISIMVDLPGPKMRVGVIKNAPVVLKKNDTVTLVTGAVSGDTTDIPVDYKALASLVSRNSIIYLNDGFIQLKVLNVQAHKIACRVMIGGTLLSHKGLNIPRIKSNAIAVTPRDLIIVGKFLKYGADIFSVSFVENENDIIKIKQFIRRKGKDPVIIAKIERGEAVKNIDSILDAADGIMVARGDLGVEIPVEQVPVVQKMLIQKANAMNKVVITATQMLLSMTEHIRPTRAEVTDVANAILDGTDAVMLSEETAMGGYPVESVEMMAKIAVITEAKRYEFSCPSGPSYSSPPEKGDRDVDGVVAQNVKHTIDAVDIKYAITVSGTGRASYRISRLKPGCWILSIAFDKKMLHLLNLSYGVYPLSLTKGQRDVRSDIIHNLSLNKRIKHGDKILLIEESVHKKEAYYNSMDIITVPS